VQTLGEPSDVPTTLTIGGRVTIAAFVMNGTWEAVVNLDRRECRVACDTRNVRFVVDPVVFAVADPDRVRITKYYSEYPPADAGQRGWDFVYPGFAKYVHLRVDEWTGEKRH